MYNSVGKTVHSSHNMDINKGNNSTSLPIKGLSTRIYILKAYVEGEENSLTVKVQKD